MPVKDKNFMSEIEGDIKERTIDIIKNNSFWIPTENEDGAILFVMGQDAVPKPVLTKDGFPVKYKWSEIRENGIAKIRTAQEAKETKIKEDKVKEEARKEDILKRTKDSEIIPVPKGRIF